MGFELLDHTGDVAVALWAPGLEGLAAEGIRALRSLVFEGEPEEDAPRVEERFEVRGVDAEEALVQALSEALHRMQHGGLWPERSEVQRSREEEGEGESGEIALHVVLSGPRSDGRALRRVEEIKAVTHCGLELRPGPRGVEAQVVLDL
jgi:SHS2 domain-containing protein